MTDADLIRDARLWASQLGASSDRKIANGIINTLEEAEAERDRAQTEIDLVARAIPGVRYMDPPDGGSVTIAEQVGRMAEHVARLEAALRGIGLYEGDAYHLGSRELCQIIAHLGATARAALEPK